MKASLGRKDVPETDCKDYELWDEQAHAEMGSAHVKFSKNQLYISMYLLKQVNPDKKNFDLMVNKTNRTFILKFHLMGRFKLKTMPGQVGVSRFVAEFKPVIGKRIPMTRQPDEIWMGHLDDIGL